MTCLSALRKSRSFGEQVRNDSTGLIVAHLLAAQLGCACIPERWLAPLELREVIEQVAVDIDEVPRAYGGEYGDDRIRDEQIWQRYPGR